jgi:hypothetical protein
MQLVLRAAGYHPLGKLDAAGDRQAFAHERLANYQAIPSLARVLPLANPVST